MQAKNQFSRRQIRIKIFQNLYGNGAVEHYEAGDQRRNFLKGMNDSETAFAALTLFIVKVFDYTLIYANKKASKYIQTEADKVDTELATIPFLVDLKNNASFTEAIKTSKLLHIYPDELVKNTFLKLIKTEEYQAFHANKNDAQALENLILRTAEYTIDTDELASEFFDEKYINWEDDIEVIQRWLALLIKQPQKIVFRNTLTQEKKDFAQELMDAYYTKQDYLNKLIAPKLKNWDADRVAVIDLILIRMGLSELLFFPEIPVKVTINEYIDIAKMYSTDQSGQFVNGVLDNLKRDLEKEGSMRKHA